MVANGHNWSSIKSYTLSEVGCFFKAVMIQERTKKAQNISDAWQANNLTFEGLKSVLKSLELKSNLDSNHKIVHSPETVKNDWKKLASFMAKNRG